MYMGNKSAKGNNDVMTNPMKDNNDQMEKVQVEVINVGLYSLVLGDTCDFKVHGF